MHCMALVNMLRSLWTTTLINSNYIEQHSQQLEDLLERLEKYKLRLKLKKFYIFKEETRSLGLSLLTQGVMPDPKKLPGIRDFPVLKNTK